MKVLKQLAPLSLLVLMVACSDPYKKGFEAGSNTGYAEGYDVGYDEGTVDGDADGYARAKAYFETAGFNEGFADGKAVGIGLGYAQGYNVGKNETYRPAYNRGYNVGYDDGEEDGYRDGYGDGYNDGRDDRYDQVFDQGYAVGYARGYDEGEYDGFDIGYDSGFDDGYDVGYDDGFADGSLSVGKSKTFVGYANLISLAHNDLIDYTKIQAPKQTKLGLVANGRVILSSSSLTNKDTLKKLAVVEQYLVIEMAKQVKGKFGLSAERSLKIAKAANHFRKYSSKRALTSEDTNAYASEIIGSDFKALKKAYTETLHGDVGAFTSVLETAAEKNGTSPENISVILAKYFM